jgi:hypothetical protein
MLVDLRAKFPQAEVIELNSLIHEENVGKGPWALYIYDASGYHDGKRWFRNGPLKYPAEEISFARAKQYCETAVGKGLEVRICDGMDHLVFHSERGKVVYGGTFWNEASPDPAVVKVADRLKGKK